MGAKLNLASSGWVDMNALAQVVWEYGVRSLTESAGLSTEEHDKLMGITGGGGWVSINYGAINSHTTKKVEELKEQIAQIPKTDISGIETKLNETNSHIDIAKWEIIDTIKQESIEVSSDVIRKTKDLETSNVKTRNLVRQKTEKINKKLDKDEKDEKEWDEVLELLKEIKEEQEDNELLDFLDDIEAKDIETLLT